MTNPGDLLSISQLFQLLERKVDKQIDDSRYASSITTKRDRQGGN